MSKRLDQLPAPLGGAIGAILYGVKLSEDVAVPTGVSGGVAVLDSSGRLPREHRPYDGIVDVKVFGAKGDGVTDDTAAIQLALDSLDTSVGGTLFFPAGTYMVQAIEANYLWLTASSNRKNYAALLVPSNVLVFGVGSTSEIKLIGTPPSPGTTDGRGDYATTHMLVNKGAIGLPKTIVNRNIRVRDLKFNGNGVQQSGEGVSFCGVEGFSVEWNDFTGSYYETNYFVFSRGGEFARNRCYENGIYQIDGGGPMVDSSSDVNVHDNIITDSGYYAILLIDSYNVSARGNRIYPVNYLHSAGFQAVRVAGCSLSDVSDNMIMDSGYSAIWVHNGFSNTVAGNTIVHAGYAAGGGSNIHGITADYIAGSKAGRHRIAGNKVFDSNGAGIAVLEALPSGTAFQENAGSTIVDNVCMFNGRDGIAVAGKFHRINRNTTESNGISVADGIVGNGYNGISLNGARYCVVTENASMDIPQAGSVPLNMDARNNTAENPPRAVAHAARTQNYGIVEFPTDTREEIPTTVARAGTTVTVTRAGHSVVAGGLMHCYNGVPNDYNGYFIADVTGPNAFTYQMIGNPNTIASITTNGSKMIITTVDPHYLGVGEVWNCYISNGDGAGDWFATITGANTAQLENMPNGYGVAGSTAVNFCQFGGGDVPDTMIAYAAESIASDYNVIRDNVLVQNLANPVLGVGPGYKAFTKDALQCGANSQVTGNFGQS